jgi:hypothetical protein
MSPFRSQWPLYASHRDQLARALAEPCSIRFTQRGDEDYMRSLLLEHLHHGDPHFAVLWIVAPDGQTESHSRDGEQARPSHDADAVLKDLVAFIKNPERNTEGARLIWIKDLSDQLVSPALLSRLKTIDRLLKAPEMPRHRIILSGEWDSCPTALASIAVPLDLERPRDGDGKTHLTDFVRDMLQFLGFSTNDTEETIRSASRLLRGMDAATLRNVLRSAEHDSALTGRSGGDRGRKLLAAIRTRRDSLLAHSSVIEVLPADEGQEDLGGLEHLKYWLQDAAEILEDVGGARASGVLPPRALLLAGVPGCGKSLAARVTASKLNRTLLRLDVGRLMGKYLGESESNLDKAIKVVEAAAPCVLLIDEMEKALAGSNSSEGGGTTARMLGRLLTWMQEHRHDIFIVATVNAVDRIPPELLRRGRFDKFFFVDLPNEEERAAILKVQFRKCGWILEDIDLEWLAGQQTKSCTGADLEALVKFAIQAAWLRDNSREDALQRAHLTSALENFEPYGRSNRSSVEDIRKSLSGRGFSPASLNKNEPVPEPREPRGMTKLPTVLRQLFETGEAYEIELQVNDSKYRLTINEDRSSTLQIGSGDALKLRFSIVDTLNTSDSVSTWKRIQLTPESNGESPTSSGALSNIKSVEIDCVSGQAEISIWNKDGHEIFRTPLNQATAEPREHKKALKASKKNKRTLLEVEIDNKSGLLSGKNVTLEAGDTIELVAKATGNNGSGYFPAGGVKGKIIQVSSRTDQCSRLVISIDGLDKVDSECLVRKKSLTVGTCKVLKRLEK